MGHSFRFTGRDGGTYAKGVIPELVSLMSSDKWGVYERTSLVKNGFPDIRDREPFRVCKNECDDVRRIGIKEGFDLLQEIEDGTPVEEVLSGKG